MPFYLSKITGDGSDAEGNEFRPAIPLGVAFSASYEPDNSRALVFCKEGLPINPLWQALEAVDLETRGVPIADLSNVGDVAQRVARRILIRQLLRGNDFPNLSVLIRNIPPSKRQAMAIKLAAHGVDMSDLAGSMTVREGLLLLLPRLRMRPFAIPNLPAPKGSFTDAFTRANENLEASANWTLTDGAAGSGAVRSNQCADLGTGEAAYQCPSQASTDHYTQAAIAIGSSSFHIAVRLTDSANFIAARRTPTTYTDAWELYKRNAGTFTLLGSSSSVFVAGDTLKIEANGNSIEVFQNGVSIIGPVTESFNNTEVRQGIVPRWSATYNPWLDDFEAGALGVAGTPLFLPGSMSGLGSGGPFFHNPLG